MRFLLIALVFFFTCSAYADEIHLLDGKTVKGKILRVTSTDVEYSETDGKPFLSTPRNLIFKIVYDDGTSVVILKDSDPVTADTRSAGKSTSSSKTPDNLFFEFEGGWNGYCGIGGRLDYRIVNGLAVNAGLGIGCWGWRPSAGLRYYVNYPYGLAFGLGAAYNTGLKDYKYKMETENSAGVTDKETVTFDLKPVPVINATCLYSFEISNGYKVYFEAGWCFSLKQDCYTYTTASGNKLTKKSKDTMDIIKPGGIILSAGMAFF